MQHSLFRLLGIAMTGLLLSNAQAENAVQTPTAEKLLDVPVGQTQIPRSSQPQRLTNPYAGDSSAITKGGQWFNAMNCVGCHAPEGGGGMGPPLSDNTWIYGGEPAQIYLTIVQGRPNGMPSFAQALPPEAIWQIVSYIETLNKSDAKSAGTTSNREQQDQP